MRIKAGLIADIGCIAAAAVIFFTCTANAAVVPFNGTEYSWLHLDVTDPHHGPTGDWLSEINDTITVRTGDVMQFQNRWYNGYDATVDLRISYGGSQPYVCTGADESVYYGLNYGDYYPSTSSAVPFYSTVRTSPDDPFRAYTGDTFSLIVNLQYVYNGLTYGSNINTDKWGMQFEDVLPGSDTSDGSRSQGQPDSGTAPTVPDAARGATGTPASGPGPGTMATIAALVTTIFVAAGRKRRRPL